MARLREPTARPPPGDALKDGPHTADKVALQPTPSQANERAERPRDKQQRKGVDKLFGQPAAFSQLHFSIILSSAILPNEPRARTATMPTFAEIVTYLMTPSWPVVILGLLVVLGAPVLLHIILASSVTYIVPPVVLLLGPDGGGKTSLQTLYERGDKPSATHTSQTSQSIELNASTDSATKTTYRNHDESDGTYTKFLLVDTPGHGKLRNVAMGKLSRAEKLRAVVFVVDAAALGEHEVLAPTAQYLYDVLLHLQKKATATGGGNGKDKQSVPVLIAANKMDLFTALPASMVKASLEGEISRIRASRSKGLLDSGVGADDIGSEEQDGWLGEYGSDKFTFAQMQEFDIDVEVLPGSVMAEKPDADKWWWWIAQRI